MALAKITIDTDNLERSRLMSGLIRAYTVILSEDKENISLRKRYESLLKKCDQHVLRLGVLKELQSLDGQGDWSILIERLENKIFESGRTIP